MDFCFAHMHQSEIKAGVPTFCMMHLQNVRFTLWRIAEETGRINGGDKQPAAATARAVDEERQREQQGDKARADRAAAFRQKTVQEADRKQAEEEDQELHEALMAFKKKESERQRRAAEKKEADDEAEEIRLQVKRFKEAEREREREGEREREREEDAARTKEDKESRIKEQDEAARRKTEGEESARRNAVADKRADEPKMRVQETVSQPKQTADKRKTGTCVCIPYLPGKTLGVSNV